MTTPKLKIPRKYSPEPIAIVGLGAIMPDADNAKEFWSNIITGKNSISEVPPGRWNPELYFDEDRDAPDKTYSKIGAFVKNFKLNPIEYRIPPNVLTQIDMVQQWALASAKEALEDANYDAEDFPREKTAVIIGNSLGGEKSFELSQRVYYPSLVQAIKQTENFNKLSESEQEELLKELEEIYKKDIPVINEDSMPGELANIVAGRVAATFNLRGKNMTSDAACASSLAAIDVAYKGLQSFEYDAAVVGGSDRSMDPPTFVKFAKIGALSAEGSFPFDERANGFVQGEGAGMMVLKRLSDAQKAGDKIYALITGVGSSSDGKGKGITAPNPIGQELAVRRALEAANISANDLQLIEAHGTSTSVGDFVEVTTIEKVFKEHGVKPQQVRLGSIKSQIGHLKSAAGAAGLVKTTLAIYHKTFPPSINFETPNPKIDWENSPFIVNTQPIEWPKPANTSRRAGVSSFGFGGTNFHVIMEEYDPAKSYETADEFYASISRENSIDENQTYQEYVKRNQDLLLEPIFISGDSKNDLVNNLENLIEANLDIHYLKDKSAPTLNELIGKLRFSNNHRLKVGLSPDDLGKLDQLVSLAKDAINDEKKRSVAQNRGIFTSLGMPKGKIAFVFPGQGSQYADMMADLANKYQIVQDTFDEADKILADMLDKPLSKYIMSDGKDRKATEEGLRQTEITQPAMLTADIALYRLMHQFGANPDMVAGHSLGEFAALVVAGVLTFSDALKAVAIRGRAMSEVDAEDKGTMASITGNLEEVEKILKKVDGYAIAANKNSLSSTVISGSTPGIEEALEKFKEAGLNAIPLNVSAAFHTKIVEPAAEPLSKFLDEIDFLKPKIPITSNVTGEFFPEDPEKIRSLMKQQVGASVEWTKQVQSMFSKGATKFFEIGPKRALSSFVSDILTKENVLSVVCNHPKKGGVRTLNDALAALVAINVEIKTFGPNDEIYHPKYRINSVRVESQVSQQDYSQEEASQRPSYPSGQQGNLGYDQYQSIVDQVAEFIQSDAGKAKSMGMNFDNIVITGTGVGLPGIHKEVFAADNVDRILQGDNLIEKLPKEQLQAQLEKNIRRLIKKSSGEAEFYHPSSFDDVIRLAGQKGKFDLIEEFGIKEEIASTYDIATSLAIASGLEALKDAGIPLVREYRKTSTGSYLPGDYVLPKELQQGTGIIFSSAFPGFDSFAKEITSFKEYQLKEENRDRLTELYGEISRRIKGEEKDFLLDKIDRELQELDKEVKGYTFNRKILLEVLSFGHAQFAQLIKAKGPNTQVNAACASTTQALGIAEDWIRTGRAKRVLVISADNITSDNLFEWLGSGFLASGAASIKDKVEEAALPFDRRRGGMIIGMGAAGFVIEPETEAMRRGVIPIVDLVGTHFSNSAYHGTRLDTQHVSLELQNFMDRVERVKGITREEIAKSLMFMSHETYTPRRGGSAAAEIRSLRETFGSLANKINIANTKGFTGHPMGAGIEDAIAIKSVEKGKIPPIANFKEPDPDLGDLKLSQGGSNQVDYALRLAAGFGSQISFALYKRRGSGNRMTSGYNEWVKSIGGSVADLYLEGKTLKLKDKGKPAIVEPIAAPVKAPLSNRSKSRPIDTSGNSNTASRVQVQKNKNSKVSSANKGEILDKIQDVMADMTGYPKDMLDPTLDIEADLGIDTVKMAESIGQLNDTFGVPAEETMNIADYNTIDKVADYYANRLGEEISTSISSVKTQTTPSTDVDTDKTEIIGKIQKVMADMTGYPVDMLDPNLDIEADLGIDTVKMAESIGQLNDTFGVPAEETMNIADYNTIDKVADYYAGRINAGDTATTQTKSSITTIKSTQKEVSSKPSSGIFEKIVAIISNVTGYPEVMIPDGSINLRNDLGVDDQIKSEIDKGVSSEFDVNVSSFDYCVTVQDYLDIIGGGSVVSEQQSKKTLQREPKPQEKIDKNTKKSLFTDSANVSEEVRQKVYASISEVTGYPTMMIEDGLNLKNDLGIGDVTKQNIVNTITSEFKANVSDLMDSLSVGDLLHVLAGEDLSFPEKVEEKSEAPRKSINTSETVEETLKSVTDIIAEKTGYPPEMLDPSLDLESELGIDTVKQAEIFGVAREKYGIPPIDGMLLSDYNTINKLAELLNEKAGSADDTEVSNITDNAIEVDEPSESTYRYVIRENQVDLDGEISEKYVVFGFKKSMTKKFVEKLDTKPSSKLKELKVEAGNSLVLITPDEGLIPKLSEFFLFLKENVEKFKRLILVVKIDNNDTSITDLTPLQGSVAGMFKALAMEFPQIEAKIVLFNKWKEIYNELELPGVEVVYRKGKRFEIALSSEDLPQTIYELPEHAVLLASGGAQGITYELVKSIVNDSSTVILLGRTEIRNDVQELSKLSEKQLETKKMDLMREMQGAGEKVTPVILEKEWSKREKSLAVFNAIKALSHIGCDVIYQSVDVTNKSSVENAFSNIRDQIGNKDITHFIHGAGIEISRATQSKSIDEFNLVYNVKATGFENLLSELSLDKLQIVVGFSSVAGRFGNATQVDYSAANEYLAKRCAQLDKEGIRSLVIDWSAWAEIGMATRGSTMKVLESQGITAIPVEEGIKRFHSELAIGNELEVVITGQLGALASKVNWYKPDFFRGIMMDDYSGAELRSNRVLSLSRDRYLDDHRIEGKAVLPGVMGLETMAEVTRAVQDRSVAVIHDIEFASPVKLPRDQDLEIVTHAKRIGANLNLELKSKFIGPDGKQLGDLRNHFKAIMVAEKRLPGFPVMKKKRIIEVKENSILSKEKIYETFFHGPSYQVIEELNQIYEDAVFASFSQPNKTMFQEEHEELEINPLMIEAAFQTAGLHLLYVKKVMGLPAGVDAIHFFDTGNKPDLITAYFISEDDQYATYHVEIMDDNGICLALLHNYKMIKTGNVETEDLEVSEKDDLISVRKSIGKLDPSLLVINTDCLEEVPEDFINEFLGKAEQTRFSALKAMKKRAEWLAGRIAAKITLASNLKVGLRSIEIEKDENRSPFARIGELKKDVSITHSNGIAIAVADLITVDLEKIEKRANSFIKESFSEEEIKEFDLLNNDDKSVTKYWTMKEAHLKRMRIGLKTPLHGVKINANGGNTAIVTSPQGSSFVLSEVTDNFVVTIAKPDDEAKITSLF